MKNSKKNFKLMLSLLLVLSTFFTSCNPDDDGLTMDDGNNNNNNLPEIFQGNNVQRDFMGRVVDEANLPIEDVVVTIGVNTASTDANGVFIIQNTTVKERQAFITAQKTGYLKGMRSVVPTSGTNNVRFMLVAKNITATVTSGVNSEVNLPNGTKVKFDGAFKDENGNAYTGNVDVFMYHLDPSNTAIEDIMPGNLQALNSDEEERVLETYGMLNVELVGATGEKLNIADGHVAEIEIPVDIVQTGVAPATIPLWHFDEVNGYWVEDGEADLVGGKYIGEVSHFSWWNCDAQFPTISLCLNIVDNLNIPLSNVRVELWRSGATYGRVGFSNGNGEICGLIPANETLTLKGFDQCEVEVYTTTIGPFSVDTNYGNIVMSTVTAAVITGNLVDCSSVNVTNGYTIINYGNQTASVDVTNGNFALNVIQCTSLATFTLEGVDFDTFQTTTELPFNFSNTNVGNIIACSTITEYISIQIDTNPVDYYVTNLSTSSGPGYFSVNGNNTSGDGFYVGGNNTALGTYSMTGQDFWIESSTLNLDYNIPNTIQFTLTNYGTIGDYIDITIFGNYTDTNGNLRILTGIVHVIRDN